MNKSDLSFLLKVKVKKGFYPAINKHSVRSTMSSDDIKMILRKFYVVLRTNVDPRAVTPIIEGLTVFDKQQIQATTNMDGAMLGNDKLLDTLGRRTTRTFLSFVTVLKEYNQEIAYDIMQYAQDHFPNIHTSIRNFERHHNQIPSATVKPSVASGSDAQNYPLSESHSIHQRTTFSQRPDAGSQVVIFCFRIVSFMLYNFQICIPFLS